MKRQTMAAVSVAALLFMAALATWAGSAVPEGTQLPIHWDAAGQANGFAGKWTALFAPVAMGLILSLIFYFLPALEPREEHLDRSQGLIFAAWGSLLLVSVLVEVITVGAALGWSLPVPKVITGGVGAMLVLIGNQLGKSRSMFLIGIRTPWTLSSEEVWVKTNRLGGKLMLLSGVVFLAAAFAPLPSRTIPLLIVGVVAVMVLIPFVYSYILWRGERSAER